MKVNLSYKLPSKIQADHLRTVRKATTDKEFEIAGFWCFADIF